MTTKEDVEAIRAAAERVISALDDANKRIGSLRGLCDTLERRADAAEAKLAKVRKYASDCLPDALERDVLAILDGKDTP